MKKVLTSLSLLAGATLGYAQGTINWTDFVSPAGVNQGFSITIFSGNGASTGETPGTTGSINNTSADLPAGTATYSGAPLSGTGFTVGLYLDSSPALVSGDVASGSPVATDTFQTGGNAGTWFTGSSLTAVDPSGAPGGTAFAELAAWNNQGGTIGSYAASITSGIGTQGFSGPATSASTLGGGSPPATPGTLEGSGVQDFATAPRPEVDGIRTPRGKRAPC
jgi:hypothetical protein